MTIKTKHIEQAFDLYMPKIKEQVVPKRIDYSVPTECPYCHKPMILSKVRKGDGVLETVFLCREDRSVGCVPDEILGEL